MLPCRACPPQLLRALVASVVLAVYALGASGSHSPARAQSPAASAQALRSSIASDRARLRSVNGRIAALERRVGALQAQVDARRAEQASAHTHLVRARARLLALEEALAAAGRALSANLRADYMGERPDSLTVVLRSKGFSDLLERVAFLQRMRNHDVELVQIERRTRLAVIGEATRMAALEARERRLAATVQNQRNQVAAGRVTLVRERIAALRGLSGKQARLRALNRQLSALRASQAAAARPASRSSFAVARDQPVQSGSGTPAAVSRAIAAGNAIATLPYRFGGGHGSFHDSAYDCSGSVSYVLGAAGLLSSPLDSTGFESWGEAGPGRWITVYANSGHAWMTIAGRRFDTGGGGGSRWHSDTRGASGYVARHPPGL